MTNQTRTGCAPDGQHCTRCAGTHNPTPGCSYVTSRTWDTDEEDTDEGQA